MFRLLRLSKPKKAWSGSSIRLRLESLEYRDQPGGMFVDPLTPPPPFEPPPVQIPPLVPPPIPPANLAPTIANFNAEQIGNGLYVISGQVNDENPDGLTVILGGSTSATSTMIVVQSDGSFSCIVQLAIDGTDTGTISATTTDDHDVESEEVYVFVSPTPR